MLLHSALSLTFTCSPLPLPPAAKARTEAEEAQRVLLAALNGIAGLLILQDLLPEAVGAYREALARGEFVGGGIVDSV